MDLDEFTHASKRAGWAAEDDVGFHMDVDAGLASEQESFRWDFQPADTVETLVFEIEWIGEGSSLSDIKSRLLQAVRQVCGEIAVHQQGR